MKYLLPILIALALQVAALIAPLLVLLALPFIHWDHIPSVDGQGRYPAVRGDFPRWLAWLGTPDERLPGGLYEPAVFSIYQRFGRFFCAWYWAGVRNRMHGLAAMFGRRTLAGWEVDGYGYQEREDLWFLRYPLLGQRFAFKAGYRIYQLLDGNSLAVPVFTITKA